MDEALPDCDECPLRRIAICGVFSEVAPDEFQQLRRPSERVKGRRLIFRAGAAPTFLATLRVGWAVSFRILSDGRRQVFDVFLPGDTIGLTAFGQGRMSASVQTLVEAEICKFDCGTTIKSALANPRVANALLQKYVEYARSLEDRLVDISRYSAVSRIASLVLQLRERLMQRGLATSSRLAFPLKQSHIADALGLTTAHVNRMLRELRARNVFSLSKDHLIIENQARLKELVRSEEGWR